MQSAIKVATGSQSPHRQGAEIFFFRVLQVFRFERAVRHMLSAFIFFDELRMTTRSNVPREHGIVTFVMLSKSSHDATSLLK